MALFSKETVQNKTTWGIIAFAVWRAVNSMVVLPPQLDELVTILIGTFTGVAARDSIMTLQKKVNVVDMKASTIDHNVAKVAETQAGVKTALEVTQSAQVVDPGQRFSR